MCLPLPETDPVIAYEAPRALHRAFAVFMLIVQLALAEELRPEVSFTPGAPVEVAPSPPPAGPPRHHRSPSRSGDRDEEDEDTAARRRRAPDGRVRSGVYARYLAS